MKLISSQNEHFVFEFTSREKDLLLATLSFYPLINPDYHRLTKSAESGKMAEQQKLLRDAMEGQRRDHKKQLNQFIESIDWNTEENNRFRLPLTSSQIDWLLVLLNDVRVGAWDILGRPNHEQRDQLGVQSKNAHYYGVMELSGLFQSAFLHALENKTESS